MTVTDSITLSIAILGAALGVINTWQALSRDRIRLRVVPKIYFPVAGGGFLTVSSYDKTSLNDPKWQTLRDSGKDLCIEVVNRSFLPVTISEVGFIGNSATSRLVLLRPLDVGGSTLPHRLEPLSATIVYGSDPSLIGEHLSEIKKAYCRTDCGRTFFGNSPALRDLIRRHIATTKAKRVK